jgi:hypothetical protein
MTTIKTTRLLSLHDVINEGTGGANRLDDHLARKVREAPRLGAALPSTHRSIDGQLHQAIDAALRHDLVTTLAAGWRASAELREAARRSTATPGVAFFVELVTLAISQGIRPSVRLYLDAKLAMTVELEILTRARFFELTAVVVSGALIAIEFGQCTLTVSIRTSTGTPLVERTLILTSDLRLGLPHPIALTTPSGPG